MGNEDLKLAAVTPILRIFDVNKALEFYIEFLGFAVDWEHRFEEGFPLYMQVSSGACVLHLSEHHGDCCPGGAVRIQANNVRAFHSSLLAKTYKFARPGLEQTPWNSLEVQVVDPFGNRLVFYEASE
ncbi:glyoxalase superfamily protein [Paenibacillus mendelii]|uniref:Bleomycin resistance protein n=1 Tax=Paenibacillus mendelii TaxID=206163 RepID=A0ABV6JA29_9BACL|nr:glyoxalase superfamily protein [Paenibacillus mendelii]MCQ6562084.1 VOC family protein [Paenibacillus mendelii]